MEIFDNNGTHNHAQYFSSDGSYGDASDIIIVDLSKLTPAEQHFTDEVESWHDWQMPQFVRWSLMNLHEKVEGEHYGCVICENYDPDNFHLTVEDIEAELAEADEN